MSNVIVHLDPNEVSFLRENAVRKQQKHELQQPNDLAPSAVNNNNNDSDAAPPKIAKKRPCTFSTPVPWRTDNDSNKNNRSCNYLLANRQFLVEQQMKNRRAKAEQKEAQKGKLAAEDRLRHKYARAAPPTKDIAAVSPRKKILDNSTDLVVGGGEVGGLEQPRDCQQRRGRCHELGVVPKYLQERIHEQKIEKERRSRQEALDSVKTRFPEGMAPLNSHRHQLTLMMLESRVEELSKQINAISFLKEATAHGREYKATLQRQLQQAEEIAARYRFRVVFVPHSDPKPVL